MTAVPQERLARTISLGRGARVVRPSGAARFGRRAQTVAGLPVEAERSGWIATVGAAVSVDQLRLILAGRRVRLGNGAFVLAMLAGLSLTLLVLLVLNTALTTDSFELQQMRYRDSQMTVREQQLTAELAAARSPSALQLRARELGMVPAAVSPVFVNLSEGKVIGEGKAAPMPAEPEKPKVKPAVTTGVDGFPPASDVVGGESAAVAMGDVIGDRTAEVVGGAEVAGDVGQALPMGSDADTPSSGVGQAAAQGSGHGVGGEQGLGLVGSSR